MNIQKLKYKFHSGKNSKPWYYIKEYARLYTPACILIWRGQHLLDKAKKRKRLRLYPEPGKLLQQAYRR